MTEDRHEVCERHMGEVYEQLSKMLEIRQVLQETETGLVALKIVKLIPSNDGMTVVVK